MYRVFIDGSAGTTGLRIRERLCLRNDIELLNLPEELRKDPDARRDALNAADVAFLCLPDAASREAVALMDDGNTHTVLIDTSTAHRVSSGWTYGFPELHGMRERIQASRRIANPGCHASGFISLVAPLREAGIIRKDAKLSCTSLTGYSGGGKKMIAEYEAPDRPSRFSAPRLYGLSQEHKHLPEMVRYTGLDSSPIFCPIVAPFYSGMQVIVPLSPDDVTSDVSCEALTDIYRAYYGDSRHDGAVFVRDCASDPENGFLSAATFSGKDGMYICVCGTQGRLTLVSTYDNLGKGASGAAIQNMNLVMGVDMRTGLNL